MADRGTGQSNAASASGDTSTGAAATDVPPTDVPLTDVPPTGRPSTDAQPDDARSTDAQPDDAGSEDTQPAHRSLVRRAYASAARQSYKHKALALGAVLLAVTGIFGGLAAAPDNGVPGARPGAPVVTGRWTVTVEKAVLVKDLGPTLRLTRPEDHWLVVAATVEITADAPTAVADTYDAGGPNAVTVSGVTGLSGPRPDQTALIRDGSVGPVLNPGVADDVAFVWELGPADVPSVATVTVNGMTRRVNSLSGLTEWLDLAPVAVLTLSVQDRIAATTPTTSGGGG